MENKKMTAPNVSVGADTEQSPNVCTDSITDLEQDFKEIEEMQREMFRQMQPSYLQTVSMADLYETDFEAQSTDRQFALSRNISVCRLSESG